MHYGMILILCLGWTTAHAEWKVDATKSTISYISIKNNEIGETNYFTKFDAGIQTDGALKMEIDLNSANTRYKIRDQRMASLFFETNLFPKAIVTGNVAIDKLKDLKTGETERVIVNITLDLHGNKENIDANLRLVKLDDKHFMVVTESSVLLNVQAFDLVEGTKLLMDAANLNSITWIVPVNFALVFYSE